LPVQVSEVRARQLWMLVGMFDRAVGRPEMPGRAGRTAGQLFTWAALRPFWELAAAGELRAQVKDVGTPLSLASLRVVRDCLGMLAGLVVPERAVALPVLEQPELKDTVDLRSRVVLYRELADMAGRGRWDDGLGMSVDERARLLAMVAIVLDTGARSGELAALRLDDLAPGLEAVGVRRRQQKAPPNRVEDIARLAEVHPGRVREVLLGRLEQVSEATRQRVLAAADELGPLPEVEWYPLRPGSRVAVRRWLEVRQRVVDALPLTGGRSALWVTLNQSKAGPAGITVRAESLRKSYTKGVTALNLVMAGSPGWSPLPTTMEQLRRAVEVEPLAEAPTGGTGGGAVRSG
jgi:integrase